MNKLILTALLLVAPLFANAISTVLTLDATEFTTLYDGRYSSSYVPVPDIVGPVAFTRNRDSANLGISGPNGFIGGGGDTLGYHSFEAYTPFKSQMYLFAYDYIAGPCHINECEALGDVIAYGEPKGSFGPFGYNQKISGFLDEFVDVNGKEWNGYALFVGPESLTEQMIRDRDFSIVDDFFQDSNLYSKHLGSEYTLAATYPVVSWDGGVWQEIVFDPENPLKRPDGVVTLNEQYLARVSAESASVSEPATTALLGLALAVGLYSRRKKA